jgi:CHAT domain-containing protein/Tfp pilus assembly protein PilF
MRLLKKISIVPSRFQDVFCGKVTLRLTAIALAALLTGHARAQGNSQSAEVPPLTIGNLIEHELGTGQTHRYQITLTAGQYLKISVEQRGADVAVALRSADGVAMAEADSDRGLSGQEILTLVTSVACNCRLEVRSTGKTAGHYVMKLEELRPATTLDTERLKAYSLYTEARRAWSLGTTEGLRQAAAKFDEALDVWKAIGDQAGEATTLASAGKLYFDQADAKKTIEAWTQSLALWRALGRHQEEAQVLSNLGMLDYARGNYEPALTQYEQALSLHRAAGDKSWEAETLNRFGWVYNAKSEQRQAIEYYNLALPLRRSVGDRQGEAVTLNDLGRAYDALGEKQQAIEIYNQALRLNTPDEAPNGVAQILIRLGVVYESTGESQKALDAYGQALTLLERVQSPRGLASALNNVGLAHANLGDYERALAYYERSLKLSRELGVRGGEATTLNNIGLVYRAAGEIQKAVDYHQQALTIHRAANNRQGQALALQALGLVYEESGDARRALEFFEQALPLRRALGDRRGEALTLTSLGITLSTLGETQKALDLLNQALPLFKAVPNPEGEATALMGLAQVKHRLGEAAAAQSLIEQSLQLTESIRAKAPGQELRATYFAARQRRYERGIELLMQMHQDAAALQVSERARARSLLELLAEVGADVRRDVPPALLARERAVRQRLNARAEAQSRLLGGKYTAAQAAALEKEVATLTAEVQDIEAKIRHASPHYAALTQPQPLTPPEIQSQLLDENTLLLEYSLGEKQSHLWLVSHTAVSGYTLPPRAEIEAGAKKVREMMTVRQSSSPDALARIKEAEEQLPGEATRLSRMLLGPVASQLENKRLLIVASGVLEYLPFGALPAPVAKSGDKMSSPAPLIANHEIVTLPSASALGVIRREMEGRTPAANAAAIFADPVFTSDDPRIAAARKSGANADPAAAPKDGGSPLTQTMRDFNFDKLARLPFSRQEAEAALSYASGTTNLKAMSFDASRQRVTSVDLSNYRILHFATHGLLNSEHPELSGLVLSLVDPAGKPQDGFLRLHDIYDLRLRADLVVLSACQTGLGKQIRGEGLVGLTRGFMYAGAPRVIASLWQVNDAATAELMKHFYRGLLKENLRPAAALRAAQLELMKQKRWASPYYWAPFVLQGEWK